MTSRISIPIRIEKTDAVQCPAMDAYRITKGGQTCAAFYMRDGDFVSPELTDEGDVRLLAGGLSVGRVSFDDARTLGLEV